MKVWVTAVVAVVVVATAAAWDKADLDSPICGKCHCLSTIPFEVDCKQEMFSKLPDLTQENFTLPWRLDFSNNIIINVTKFPELQRLIFLLIERSHVSSIAFEAFKDLTDLKKLSLKGNKLTREALTEKVLKGRRNDEYSYPLGLESLDLSYNQLQSLESHAFRHLPHLTKLLLNNNPLHDISRSTATAINELTRLQELDLSQTGIQRLPQQFLSDLKHLKILTLAGNEFTSVPSTELNFARNLIHLNLVGNPITSISADDFPEGLSRLQELDVSAMPRLRHVGQRSFTNLRALKMLRLSDNPSLAVIDPEAFYMKPPGEVVLQEIHLQNNRLTSLDENLLPWLDIDLVDVQNNPWHCDCHLKWMATTLIPDLEKKNPQTTLSIMCAEPIADRSMKVEELLGRAHSFQCTAPEPFVQHEGKYGPLIVGTIVVGTLIFLTGTLIFVFVLYKRARNNQLFGERVKYRRAQDEEDEGVPHTVNS